MDFFPLPNHLFTALIPGEWSCKADDWFVYRRIGTTPWVDVSWRHGPGVANSRVEAGPTCVMPTCVLEAGTAPRAAYDRHAVADRIEQVARGLTYNDGADEGCAKHWLYELASRVRRGETKDPAVKSMGVAQDDIAAILRALGLGDHARPSSCHEIVQGQILPAIGRLQVEHLARLTQGGGLAGSEHVQRSTVTEILEALGVPLGFYDRDKKPLDRLLRDDVLPRLRSIVELVEGVRRVHVGDNKMPLASAVQVLTQRAVQAFEAEKMWAGHCDEFQKLAAKHSCRIFAGESAVTALARLLDSPAEKQLDKIRRAIDKRWFPPVGSSANLADEVASLADFAGKKANEAHRGDAAEKDLAEIRATVRGYDPTLGHSLRTVDAVKVLLERGGQRMKELAEIRDLLDRGCWPDSLGGPAPRKLRLAERVAEVAGRARTFAEAEQMATERAQRAEAQLREVARRVAGWVPASEGVVGRDACSGRPS